MFSRLLIFAALAVVLGIPLGMRLVSPSARLEQGVRTLVVMTPHVPQIRAEFGEAFAQWHQRTYGQPARADWRSPGAGTSELLKILEAQYLSAAKAGKFDFSDPGNPQAPPGTVAFDVLFGGGTFDHGRLKAGVKFERTVSGGEAKRESVTLPMSIPAGFSQGRMYEWFGDNSIGAGLLYDPEQYWIGTALSGFGIVYNRRVFKELGVPDPHGFADLADPALAGRLILADPRQSGSVTTTIDAILNAELWNLAASEGWSEELERAFDREARDKTPWEKSLDSGRMPSVERAFAQGWRLLRLITANSRSYAAAATKPPIDVSAGEGAAGLAIDFYGRAQAQAVLRPGEDPKQSWVEYVDPRGAAYIDADPASILRGGPDPELAKRFIEFCLTEEAQVLWQLPARSSPAGRNNPTLPDGRVLGPARYELRRMPARRSTYAAYGSAFIDQVNPFEIASRHRPAGWRPAIGPMMGAFSIDNADGQRAAWRAMRGAMDSGRVAPEAIERMQAAFFAWPTTPGKHGEELRFTAADFRAIRDVWRDPRAMGDLEIRYTSFFRERYAEVVRLAREAGRD